MPRNPIPRTNAPKPAASKQSVKTGEALTRAISGNTIVDASLRPGAPDGASNSDGAGRAAMPANSDAAADARQKLASAGTAAADETATPAPPAPENHDAAGQEALRYRRIALGAYYRAEARGFAPGHEVEDWLAAERELGEQAGEGVIG
jgi:hypothetical protein